MDHHKQMLDKEYEQLLQQFSKELEKLQLKHQQDLDRKVRTLRLDFIFSRHDSWACDIKFCSLDEAEHRSGEEVN